jgi:hypothetical protein
MGFNIRTMRDATTEADAAITGERYCTGHYAKTKLEGGSYIATGNGRQRWLCAACLAQRASVMKNRGNA